MVQHADRQCTSSISAYQVVPAHYTACTFHLIMDIKSSSAVLHVQKPSPPIMLAWVSPPAARAPRQRRRLDFAFSADCCTSGLLGDGDGGNLAKTLSLVVVILSCPRCRRIRLLLLPPILLDRDLSGAAVIYTVRVQSG